MFVIFLNYYVKSMNCKCNIHIYRHPTLVCHGTIYFGLWGFSTKGNVILQYCNLSVNDEDKFGITGYSLKKIKKYISKRNEKL